jgi:hypothetical protein
MLRLVTRDAHISERESAWATKFYTVEPNNFWSSERNLLHVITMAIKILKWLQEFWKFVHPFS